MLNREEVLKVIALHAELGLPAPDLRDKDAGGHGSYKKGEGSKNEKVMVYHGTSKECAEKILKNGLLPREFFKENKSVYASADKEIAINYALSAARNSGNFDDPPEPEDQRLNREVGIVVISDAKKAGLDQHYSSHYSGESVASKYISRVEIYTVGDLEKSGVNAKPINTLKRSLQDYPTVAYVAILFDGVAA